MAKMALSLVAPELRGAVRLMPDLPVRRPWVRRVIRVLGERIPTSPTAGVTIEQPVPGVRLYRPAVRRTNAALLWIHGGGLVIGSARQDDRLCGSTAAALGITVASASYRLAPDHPFPAPLDDCQAAWAWLREQPGVERIAIGGQSAGGGLAAALVQRLHDAGERPLAQWLFCPMLDDRTAARRELDALRHRVWNNRCNRVGWGAYLGREPGADTVAPYAVPARRAELAGLPPAWIGVGDIDLFHDESRSYADRLRAAGVPVTFRTVPGGPHGFETWATKTTVAREYVAAARDWLGEIVRS